MLNKHDMSREEKWELLQSLEETEDFFTDNSPTILQFVDDPDPDVRAQAIGLLWDYPRPDLIDLLIDKARNDPDHNVASAALVVLGRYIYEGDMADYDEADDWPADFEDDEVSQADFERTRDFLLSVARDAQAGVDSRRYALEALSFLADGQVTELIEQAYRSPDVRTKASAIFAMGRQGTVRWNDTLMRELRSTVAELRYEAVRAVGEGFVEAASPELMQIAKTADDEDLRLEAILSLGRTGGEGTFELLNELAESPDDEVREAAEVALEDWFTYHGQWSTDEEEDEEHRDDEN